MNEKQIVQAIDAIKSKAHERKFTERIDLIVNLKDVDLKKPENHVDFFIALPSAPGKIRKIAALVDAELLPEAKAHADLVIPLERFGEYAKNPAQMKKLASEYDFFIAQANIMKDIAANFGRILGSRGKMPNPKGGMVVPPKAALAPLVERLRRTVHVRVKAAPVFQAGVGSMDQDPSEVARNVVVLYKQLLESLPNQETNVRSVFLKSTMGEPVKVI
jgi:large subunit ribosomal protein L1